MNLIDEDEIPKYRKKKKSSISDSHSKSKHKHEYDKCILIEENRPYGAIYCKLCGKIKDVMLVPLNSDKQYKSENFQELKRFQVASFWQKYVYLHDEVTN